MKTIMKAFMKSSGWLVMAAALTFGFASCSSDNDAVAEQQSVKPTGKYTMTVQVTKGDADTRALKLGTDGTSVDAYWDEDEIVEVYQNQNGETLLGTLTAAASNEPTTTLTGTLNGPVANATLYFYLHGQRLSDSYSSQNGALTGDGSIEKNHDYALGSVQPYDETHTPNGFTIKGNEVIVPDGALTLESQQAIVKFTLLDAATGNPLNVTKLTVTDEALNLSSQSNETPSFISGAPLTITPPSDATSELYVAISNLNKEAKHSHLVLSATGADGNEYIYAKEYSADAPVYFTHGMYYTRTVKMKKGFTTFSENDVIKVGDHIRLTQEWSVNNAAYYIPRAKTGTLVRANIDGSGKATEAADGAYYVIKVIYHDPNDVNHDNDYNFYFFDDMSMPVGANSDGLVVTNVGTSGDKPACTIAVHGQTTYTAPTLVGGTLTYNGSAQALVTGGSATGGTIYYRYDYTPYSGSASSSSWSTDVPTGTNAGTYTVYYKVEPNAGYSGGVESTQLGNKVINRANGWVSLSPSSGTGFEVFGSANYYVSVNSHGGSLSYTKSGANSSWVSVEVRSGNQVRIYKYSLSTDGRNTTVTITSAATNNYNAASANFSCER